MASLVVDKDVPNDPTATTNNATITTTTTTTKTSAPTNDYEDIIIDSNASTHIIYHDAFSAVVYLLDATSIYFLSRCNKYLTKLCNNPNVLSWISRPRAVGFRSLSCIEHLKIFELVSKAENSFHFEWGSVQVEDNCYPYLEQLVQIMKQHGSLHIRVEGHCGLEAPPHIAIGFSTNRAASVCDVLVEMGINPRRISYIGHGNSKPKICACGPFSREAKQNRRTELFLHDETGSEFPTREPLPNISKEEIDAAVDDAGTKQREFQIRIDGIMVWSRDLEEAVTNPEYPGHNLLGIPEYNNPRENVIARIRELGEKCPDSLSFFEHMNTILVQFEQGALNSSDTFMNVVEEHIAQVEEALETLLNMSGDNEATCSPKRFNSSRELKNTNTNDNDHEVDVDKVPVNHDDTEVEFQTSNGSSSSNSTGV